MAGEERPRLPPAVKYILGNEACERFSFYGMSSILTIYMVTFLGVRESDAEANYHLFVFESDSDLHELDRRMKNSDRVLRHMIVRTDEDLKRADKLAKRNPKKERVRPAPAFAAAPAEAPVATPAPAETPAAE